MNDLTPPKVSIHSKPIRRGCFLISNKYNFIRHTLSNNICKGKPTQD